MTTNKSPGLDITPVCWRQAASFARGATLHFVVIVIEIFIEIKSQRDGHKKNR